MSDENWWWLSFTDPEQDDKLLGVVVAEGDTYLEALQGAIDHDCHPGGDVQILPLASLRQAGMTRDYAYVLLSRQDVKNAGFKPDEAAGAWIRKGRDE